MSMSSAKAIAPSNATSSWAAISTDSVSSKADSASGGDRVIVEGVQRIYYPGAPIKPKALADAPKFAESQGAHAQ